MTVIEDLKAAKAEMLKRGRCQKHLVNQAGQVCLLGAIGVATEDVDCLGYNTFDEATGQYNPRAGQAVETLRGYLPSPSSCEAYEDVYTFNDDPNTTDQDVLNLFDKALADLGGLG